MSPVSTTSSRAIYDALKASGVTDLSLLENRFQFARCLRS